MLLLFDAFGRVWKEAFLWVRHGHIPHKWGLGIAKKIGTHYLLTSNRFDLQRQNLIW